MGRRRTLLEQKLFDEKRQNLAPSKGEFVPKKLRMLQKSMESGKNKTKQIALKPKKRNHRKELDRKPGESFYAFSKRVDSECRSNLPGHISKNTSQSTKNYRERQKQKQQQKKKAKQADLDEERFLNRTEAPKFGEVASAPPEISFVPRRKKSSNVSMHSSSMPVIESGTSELERRNQLLLARQRDLTRDKLRAAYKTSKIERKALQVPK